MLPNVHSVSLEHTSHCLQRRLTVCKFLVGRSLVWLQLIAHTRICDCLAVVGLEREQESAPSRVLAISVWGRRYGIAQCLRLLKPSRRPTAEWSAFECTRNMRPAPFVAHSQCWHLSAGQPGRPQQVSSHYCYCICSSAVLVLAGCTLRFPSAAADVGTPTCCPLYATSAWSMRAIACLRGGLHATSSSAEPCGVAPAHRAHADS
jgi:hypothetical protein